MAVPTSTWGIINETFSSTNTATIFLTTPGPSTTVPGSANGPVLGNYEILIDGSFVQFLQAAGTIAANVACMISGAWQNRYIVTPTTAINQAMLAVNDRTFASLLVNNCSWFTTKGLAFPLVAATTAAGKLVASSATAGTLYAATPGTDLQSNIVNTVLVGGSAALSPCVIY